MQELEKSINVRLIDYGPKFMEYNPDHIIAVSGLLTAKSKDFLETLKNLSEKDVEKFHRESTRRGHASLLTTPVIYLWIQGSRTIDFCFSSHPFGSYLIASSRRIGIEWNNFLIPRSILNSKYKNKYEKTVKELFNVYKEIGKNHGLDYARKILPIGFKSYGFFEFPLQTILTLIHDLKNSKIPNEISIVLNKIEEIIGDKFPILYKSAKLSHLTGYPFPNIFGNDVIEGKEGIRVIYIGNLDSLIEILKKEDWFNASRIAQTILFVKVDDFISLACWNELKRHRSAPQRVESIYNAIRRYLKNPKEEYVHIPDISNNLKKKYLEAFNEALSLYEELSSEFGEAEAIYIIPHALKVRVEFTLTGYHLIHPFGFIGVRSCSTADYEIRELAEKIIKKVSEEIPELKEYLGPKCKIGFCPERKPCEKFYSLSK